MTDHRYKGTRTLVKGVSKKANAPAKSDEAAGTSRKRSDSASKRVTTNARARKSPVFYSDELLDEILDRIAGGESLVRICSTPNMPTRKAFFDWITNIDGVKEKYEFALQLRADKYAEETIEIADDGRNDTYINEKGEPSVNHDVVSRSKLRVDARKWYAAKLAPKKYGDKLDMNHGVQTDNPIMSLLKQVSGTSLPVVKDPDAE